MADTWCKECGGSGAHRGFTGSVVGPCIACGGTGCVESDAPPPSAPDTVTISRERYERLLEFEREENRRAEEEEKRREHHPGWKHVKKPGEKGPRFGKEATK